MVAGALIVALIKDEPKNKIGALQKIGDISSLQRIVLLFKRSGIEKVFIISNCEEEVKKEISKLGVIFIPQHEKDQEMFFYVKKGLEFVEKKLDLVFVMPSNVPLFKDTTIKRLLEDNDIVTIPVNKNISGHPVLINTKIIQEIVDYKGDRGLSGAFKNLNYEVKKIDVQDVGVRIYNKDEKDFDEALNESSLNKCYPEIKVSIAKEKLFFGPGVKQLLELIKDTNSLSLACKQMGISYSKGRKKVDIMENQLGYKIINRVQGGEFGGSSTLTKKGIKLLENYIAYEKKIKEYAKDIFKNYFNT